MVFVALLRRPPRLPVLILLTLKLIYDSNAILGDRVVCTIEVLYAV